MLDVDIRTAGDAAVLAVLGDRMDAAGIAASWSLARTIGDRSSAGILDIVPAYASVLVRFDPLVIDVARVIALVRGAAETSNGEAVRRRRAVTLGVCFGGVFGVDFETTAHELGMREARLRDTFCKASYSVAFLGFLAGFPYLYGLPASLAVPRLPNARPRVPAGSVAMAAGQCGVYPRESPGGWRLLGRTAAPLFDPHAEPPALLATADIVRFEPRERFEDTRVVEMSGA